MTDGDHLERLWNTAAARPVVSAFRTADTGVGTSQGPLLVGVDAVGRRHLLVPIAAKHTLKQDVEGRAVLLRRRALEDEHSYRSYASLELLDERLSDLFTALCVEVTDRIAAAPGQAVAVLRKVLEDWRSLLAGTREILGPAALAGLFGELHLLRALITRDPGAVAFWTGPSGSAQDFHHGPVAVEVKTTLAPEGRVVRVHGADQLDVAAPGRLLLHWTRMRSDQGMSVPDLVDEVLARTDDAGGFRVLLSRAGYQETDREIYARRRFEVLDSRTYEVGPGFPRIVPAGLVGDAVLAGVGPVEYSVDLDAQAAHIRRSAVDPTELLLEGA